LSGQKCNKCNYPPSSRMSHKWLLKMRLATSALVWKKKIGLRSRRIRAKYYEASQAKMVRENYIQKKSQKSVTRGDVFTEVHRNNVEGANSTNQHQLSHRYKLNLVMNPHKARRLDLTVQLTESAAMQPVAARM
jgi:hypothetical protein